MENQREWQAWWSQISASGAVRLMPVLRQHPNTWQQQKDTTDAWLMLVGFTIPSSFLLTPSAPRCDLIFNDSAELQRHLLWNIRLPEGHSLVINAETLSVLVEAISGRRSATDGEQDGQQGRRKHIKSQPGGTKDDVAMGGTTSGQWDLPSAPTRVRTRSYTTLSSRTLCVLSKASEGRQRRSLHVLEDQARGAPEYNKPKEQLRAYSELAATKGEGVTASVLQGWRLSWACCKRCRREAAQWERQTRLE